MHAEPGRSSVPTVPLSTPTSGWVLDGSDAVIGTRLAELARGASHGLLNLHGALLMRIQLLRQTHPEVDSLRDELDRLEELIRDCMDAVAPLQQLGGAAGDTRRAPSQTDVASHLRASEAALNRLVPPGTDVRTDLPDEPVHVPLGPDHLEMILHQLLTNAGEALRDRTGTIVVRLRRREIGERREAVLEVADNGPGMSAELARRATRPYVTTKRSQPGAGLGLTVVETAVVAAGGSLTITSAPDGGCTVRLTFETIAAHPQ